MDLILASQSPRRKELMGFFKLPFLIRAADIDESMDPEQDPRQEVARVSRAKALATERKDTDVVIAADTIVVCDGQVLGKPENEADAVRMLTMLSGRWHQVMTGLTVLRGERIESVTEVADICFRSCPGGRSKPMSGRVSPWTKQDLMLFRAERLCLQSRFGAIFIM